MRDLLENGIGAKRIRSFRETVFAEMSALSQQYGAVNLGQGFPDFPGPSFVKEAAKRAIDGDHNQYAHPHGAFPLREAIATEWGERFGRVVDPVNQVTVTSGATEAVFDIILALIDPGDELVVFEPYYDSYPASVTMAGGVMKLVRLEPPDWSFDPDTLRAAITENTKVILLNTPHNPTGKVFSRPELEFIANLAIDHDLLVVTDEVYDRIVFDGVAHRTHRHLARYVGADAHHQFGGQDILPDRLEGGVCHWPGTTDRCVAVGASVGDVRNIDAIPDRHGGSHSCSIGHGLLRISAGRVPRAARGAGKRLDRRRASSAPYGWQLFPDDRVWRSFICHRC